MSGYTQALLRLQDALSREWITQREYETGAALVRREHGRVGWGGTHHE